MLAERDETARQLGVTDSSPRSRSRRPLRRHARFCVSERRSPRTRRWLGEEAFAWAHPNRYFEARIAGQTMVSAAAGLAAAGKTRAAILAVEDHDTGGRGSEVAEASAALAAPVTVETLPVRRIPKSGCIVADLLDYVGLSVPEIAAAAEGLVRSAGIR